MAVLFITELSLIGADANGHQLSAAKMPPVAEQTVAIGAGSVASAAFNASTAFVRLVSDVPCSVSFGAAPTATATTARLAANAPPEYFAVTPGQKVAVITNT